MHQQGILKNDDVITRFFRLCSEMCVDLCYRAMGEATGTPPTNQALIRAKCFYTLDAFVRLIALLIKHSGDNANTVTKINLLNKVNCNRCDTMHYFFFFTYLLNIYLWIWINFVLLLLIGPGNCGWGFAAGSHCENDRVSAASLSQDFHHALHWAECTGTYLREHQLPGPHSFLVRNMWREMEQLHMFICCMYLHKSFMNNAHSSYSWFAITLQQHVPCVETCQITWIFLRMVGVYISPGFHWQNVSSDPSAKGQFVHGYNFQMKVFPTLL